MAADGGPVIPDIETDGEDRAEITRRLSDKILSAFSHAYAVGEIEIANRLREVLEMNECAKAGSPEMRAGCDPLGQAKNWVLFVEARNKYKWVCENKRSQAGADDEALEMMKEAYRRWSSD